MKVVRRCVVLLLIAFEARAADLPHLEGGQLRVHGKPFLIRGGELGNSSAGTAAQADTILTEMARLNLNTVLMPVAWEQIEPNEGTFDFSILDHWIDMARRENLHLVLLWFGSWKNAFSEYAPDLSSAKNRSSLEPSVVYRVADLAALARLLSLCPHRGDSVSPKAARAVPGT